MENRKWTTEELIEKLRIAMHIAEHGDAAEARGARIRSRDYIVALEYRLARYVEDGAGA